MEYHDDYTLHDVLIIGAGPCGLAVAARLRESTPAATFTDEEHQRYHWIRKHGRRMSIKNRRTGHVSAAASAASAAAGGQDLDDQMDMLVLDASGDDWMARWHGLFRTFDIHHLRSPMFFHVDPHERDSLLAYAHRLGRADELLELRGCVGKELSKNERKKRIHRSQKQSRGGEPLIDERERNDYYVPSTKLFQEHCKGVVEGYDLRPGIIRKETVSDIEYDYVDHFCESDKIFTVKTDKGTHFARSVVLAVGPGNKPSMPPISGIKSDKLGRGHCHAMQITKFPDPNVKAKIACRRQTSIVVVGGGLTSAQLAILALSRGVSKVHLLMRGGMKIKPFDVGLEWVGKFRNLEHSVFWSADTDEERWEMIKCARNGGSIPMPYKKQLDKHVAGGRLEMHLHTTIGSMQWDDARHSWDLQLSQACERAPTPHQLASVDYVYFATGVQTDVATIPFLDTIRAAHPIPTCGGLPCLNEDMMWCDDVPLFVTGRLGGLRLGPGAANLAGARIGAERIAWGVQDLLRKSRPQEQVSDSQRFRYLTGRGNRFEGLHGSD